MFDKAQVKRFSEITDEGEYEEGLDVHLKFIVPRGLPLPAVLEALQGMMTSKFNHLFREELGLMPARIEQWQQQRLFDAGDVLDEVARQINSGEVQLSGDDDVKVTATTSHHATPPLKPRGKKKPEQPPASPPAG